MFNKASLLHLFQYLFLPKGRVQNFKGKSLKTAEQHPSSLWGRTKGDGYTTPWLKAFLNFSSRRRLQPPSSCLRTSATTWRTPQNPTGVMWKTAWRTLLISFTSSDSKRRGNHPLYTLQHQPNSHACSSAKRIKFVTENRQYKSAKIPEFSSLLQNNPGRCMPATKSFLHFSFLLQPFTDIYSHNAYQTNIFWII